MQLDAHFQRAGVAGGAFDLGFDGDFAFVNLVFLIAFAVGLARWIGNLDIVELRLGGNADDRLHTGQVFVLNGIGVDVPAFFHVQSNGERLMAAGVGFAVGFGFDLDDAIGLFGLSRRRSRFAEQQHRQRQRRDSDRIT